MNTSTELHGPSVRLTTRSTPAGQRTVEFRAAPGLYQFSVVIGGEEFDWESLYIRLHKFNNRGERTGPWDFEVGEGNRALVPSFRVSLDGRPIGLWYCQRVPLADLEARLFRGRCAFHVETEGWHCLEFEPYNAPHLPWHSAWIEPDPIEKIGSWPAGLARDGQQAPVAAWSKPDFWDTCRELLAGERAMYADGLREACQWAMARGQNSDLRHSRELDIPLMVAGEQLGYCPGGIELALEIVDSMIAKPHWGNPRADAYGHDGDMGAGLFLMTLSLAYRMLGDRLGDERRQRLLEKVALQGRRFFRLLLLHRDYWGGSVLQDHGRRSASMFTVAALNLLGEVPEAELWVRVLIERLRRAIDAQPVDGHIPPSSYRSTYLYLQELTLAAWTLESMGGPDLTRHRSLEAIPRYVWSMLPAAERHKLSTCKQLHVLFNGGTSLFNWQAARDGDGAAEALHRLFIASPPTDGSPTMRHHSVFWSFFLHRPMQAVTAPPPASPARLHVCADSAAAYFVDDTTGSRLALACGPWCGHNAAAKATGPCDRMRMDVAAGSFELQLGGLRLIASAPSRYFLHTGAGSTWLVDGKGQRGDVGYPMSIPSCPHWGEAIAGWSWNDRTGSGWLELDLQPAYPGELGMTEGTRRFEFRRGEPLVMIDRIAFAEPRSVSWLFQTDADHHPRLEGLQAVIDSRLRLVPQADGMALEASIRPTHQVFSYSSSFSRYEHVRYDAPPARQFCLAFSFIHERSPHA